MPHPQCPTPSNSRGGILPPGHSQSLVDQWCCGGYWVRLSSSRRRARSPYTVLYIECMFVPVLDAGLKASLKDPLWKVNSITAFWQRGEEREGRWGEGGLMRRGLAWQCFYLAMRSSTPTPHSEPPSEMRAPSLFLKLINKISLSAKTRTLVRVTAKCVCVCVRIWLLIIVSLLCDSGPVPVLVMSLLFIASVFMLHIWGKYTRS